MGKIPASRKNIRRALLAVGAVALIAGTFPVARKVVVPTEYVTQVVDGDTFFIGNNQPIRVYGVDAPELDHCYGQDAKQALTKLILHKEVQIREPLSDGRGRIMALVYVDGISVNEFLVKNGFALYRREGGSETQSMKQANEFARTNLIGIFSPACYQLEPPDPLCTIKGNIDDRTKQKEYYAPRCAYYVQVWVEKFMGEDWFCFEKDARSAGFVASDTCN